MQEEVDDMKLLYTKYNRNRKDKYKIKTSIYENENGKRIVCKESLTDSGLFHLNIINENYYLLKNFYKKCELNIPRLENNKLILEYKMGNTMATQLLNAINEEDDRKIFGILDFFKEILIGFDKSNIIDYYDTDDFEIIFGNNYYNLCKCKSLKVSNIDLNLDNIIIDKDAVTILDYEWVFKFPLPIEFIIYRSLIVFDDNQNGVVSKDTILKMLNYMNVTKYLSLEELQQMNDKFYEYIQVENGLNESLISNNYKKKMNYYNHEELIRNTERIKELQKEVIERNSHIKLLDINIIKAGKEIERLNTHITELSHWALMLDKQNANFIANEAEKEMIIKESDIKVNNLQVLAKNSEMKNKELDELIIKLKKEIEEKNKQLDQDQIDLININEQQKQHQIDFMHINEQISAYHTEIENKKGHIELLLERERELERIHNSTGWKLLLIIYKIEDLVFPVNSKRRFIAKIIKKFIKNPKTYLRYLNAENIKKLAGYLKNEEMDRVNSRLESFEEKHTPQDTKELLIFNEEIKEYEKIDFSMEGNPLVSIVIPVYNQWNYTYNCLKSIKENTDDVSYEIIIADDVSSDETNNISNYISNINVVRNEKNLGFLLNCNNAAKRARGRYIHFLNNDTNVQKNWLSSLVELIETDNNIGMVGSKLVFSNGKLQEAGGIIWNDASGWNYGRLDDPEKPEYNYVKEVDYISGASIMIKRSLWEEIGGFDERYVPAYFEDTDLAFEVRKHGYKVLYQPKSVVVHFEGISNGTDENSGIKGYQAINRENFVNKWKDELEKNHFTNAENVFLARDRSNVKKTILVIDHYVPHYDKDAGSRNTFTYLKIFKSLNLNVIFAGDNFYKHEPYTSELQQLGIQVLYGDWYFLNIKNWIKENGNMFDIAYLNRPHIAIKYIDHIKKYTKAKIIYFGHDLHYLRELRNYDVEKNEELLRSSEKWKKIEFNLFEKADLIYAVGSFEKKVIEENFPKKIVRNIPVFVYPNIEKKNIKFETKSNLIFVGGFNHKPNVDAVIWFCEEIFPKIKEKLKDVKLYIVGSNPTKEILALETKDVSVKGYVSDEELKVLYENTKVDIIPLRYGAGVKGKVIEAFYNQIPIVTTDIGAEGIFNNDDLNVICNSSSSFAQKVINIYTNKDLYEFIVNKEYELVKEGYTYESVLGIIGDDFNI